MLHSLRPAGAPPHEIVLRRGGLFEASGAKIVSVCFPETAVLSLTESNPALDVVFLGFEGIPGIGLILGNNLSVYSRVVRITGTGFLMTAEAFFAVL